MQRPLLPTTNTFIYPSALLLYAFLSHIGHEEIKTGKDIFVGFYRHSVSMLDELLYTLIARYKVKLIFLEVHPKNWKALMSLYQANNFHEFKKMCKKEKQIAEFNRKQRIVKDTNSVCTSLLPFVFCLPLKTWAEVIISKSWTNALINVLFGK